MADLPESERKIYDMAYTGHGRGVFVDQVDGKFTERPMTPAELAAREPAMKIARQIHKLACYAAFAYIKCWEIIVPAITASEKRAETARDNALEEAATFIDENDGRGTPRQFAQAIRAMKGQRA